MKLFYVKEALGYYPGEYKHEEAKTYLKFIEVLNVVGSIPIVGVIAGVARAIFVGFLLLNFKNLNAKFPNSQQFPQMIKVQVFRAACECLFLGPLFISADILATWGRKIRVERFLKAHH